MIRVLDDAEALAAAAAEVVAAAADASVTARGEFRLGVSGGTTPERLYRRLAGPEFRGRIDWGSVVLCFADERAVPPDHPDSNFRLVDRTLAGPAGIPPSNVHRMRGEAADLAQAAREYEPPLRRPLDLLLLGVGGDGHTASIFPGSPIVAERARWVVAIDHSPKPPPRRITVTPRVLSEARAVLVLASGAEKARAVASALEGGASELEIPARLVRDRDWYLDRPAAGRLAGARAGTRHGPA